MKIAAAQVQPVKGNIDANIKKHAQFCRLAALHGADAVFFPELSLTGYEPSISKELSTTRDDERLSVFQSFSDEKKMVIGVGMPLQSDAGITISMIVFQPGKSRQVYAKQCLHEDELPYFVEGKEQVYIAIRDRKIALSICYESLLPQHAENAYREGIDLYLASVAKPMKGVRKAFEYYPFIATKYQMPVMMINCVGTCDDFISVGSSAVWNKEGLQVGKLTEEGEGLLIFDVEREEVKIV